MSENFVPEMHDLGKLVDNDAVKAFLGVEIDGHYFRATDKADLDFAKIGAQAPSNPTWIGIQYHNDPEYKSFAHSPLAGTLKIELVLTALADVLAASTFRAIPEEEKGEAQYQSSYKAVYSLWNPQMQVAEQAWSPIRGMDDLRQMIEFVNQNPNAEDFFAKYRVYLERIPEDKKPPRVVTSLLTHLTLVGKYFRVLQKHSQMLVENGEPVALIYDNHRAAGLGEMLDQWQYQIVKCTLSFPQTPVRVRDLNVLALLERHTKELLHSDFCDHVLFHTTDTLYLFLPIDGSVRAEEILKPYLDDGFFVESEVTTFNLGTLNLNPIEGKRKSAQQLEQAESAKKGIEARLIGARRELGRLRRMDEREKKQFGWKIPEQARLIGTLEQELVDINGQVERWRKALAPFKTKLISVEQASIYAEPIATRVELDTDLICELCQMRPAKRTWTTPDEALVENLCETCLRVREAGERYGAIGRWEKETPHAPVAWVKLSLDYDWAQIHIESLFENFIDELMRAKAETPKQWAADAKASLRPVALLADFTED